MRKIAPIPKKIHYCWFGGNPLTPLAKKCIASWKKYCPDYEIIEWNEKNVDIDSSPFMKTAYENKKWAFVSDYARYKIIYDEGGVYLDVDVEIIKNLDPLLAHGAYMGFEGKEYVASGLGFGATAKNEIIKEILDTYDNIDYNKHKNNPAKIATPILTTNILMKHGLIQDGKFQKVGSFTVLPEDYLCPKSPLTRLVNITDKSYSIHHYDASWVDEKERKHIDKLEEESRLTVAKFPDLITIVIPVYNGEDYLRFAIDSAINQTYKNLEVIVVDDGSVDGSEEIARSYGPRIRYIRQPNGGVASALNTGIKAMRGKYLAWLSHDDVYHTEKLEILHKELKGQHRKRIAISDWDIIDKNGALLKHSHLDEKLESIPMGFLAFDRKTWLNACAMLIPKGLFDETGLFDESLRTTQDYDMHMRMIELGATYKIVRRKLFYSRQHATQGSLTIDDDTLSNSDRMHAKIISKLNKLDIKRYFDDDINQIEESYNSFSSNSYTRTPVAILEKLIDVYGIDHEITQLLLHRKFIGINEEHNKSIASDVTGLVNRKINKPRLLFCSGYWLTGGMERVLSNLLTHLRDDYEIILLTPTGKKAASAIPIPSGIVHIKLSSDLYRDRFEIVGLAYARILDVNIMVGFLNLSEKQLRLYELCKEYDIKTIASNHEYYFYPHRSTDLSMRKLVSRRKEVFKKLDAVLWLTNFSTAVHNIDADNGYLMPNPNTFDISKSIHVERMKKNNIICVGRFNDRVKRIDRIIECFSLVHKENPKTTLTVVGAIDQDAPLQHMRGSTIRDLIVKSGINQEQIIFAGEVNDMAEYYNKADVILLTSETEGFPMVITEAMSQGLPVVCVDIPGIEDIVIDGKNGFVVNQNDTKSLASRLSEILSDKRLRDKMAANAQRHAAQFSGKTIADKWKYLIESVLKPTKNLPAVLAKELSFAIDDGKVFNRRIIAELDESVRSSLPTTEILTGMNKESLIEKTLRLTRATKRDYIEMGMKRASKKAMKKVVRKASNILGLDRNM